MHYCRKFSANWIRKSLYAPLLFSLLILSVLQIRGQENVRFYSQETSEGFVVYGDNQEYCPVSAEVTLVITNLQPSTEKKFFCVLPARSTGTEVTRLKTIKPGQPYKISYSTKTFFGNCLLSRYDTAYTYNLPFATGSKFNVSQGYKGKKTHQNENALDFEMPESTPIYAIRSGTVFAVMEKNTKNCPQKECMKFNNYIKIYHSDGTMAEYVHLKKNGSLVQPGDTVMKGQHIGYSGNTGYSSGPHLHLTVTLCRFIKDYSLETLFITGEGNTFEYLKEGQVYRRDY